MNYKDRVYGKYLTTHVIPREGDITPDTLEGRARVWRRTFKRFLPRNRSARLVDLGCGYGSIVWWLQREGFASASGVDVSTEQVEAGKRLGIAGVEQGDIGEFLRDKKACYDVIFARDILEHFRKEEVLEILSLCYHSLTEGGLLILQTPNAESPFYGRIRYGDFTHEIAFTASSLSQLLRMTGFQKMRFYPTPPVINGLEGLARFALWKVIEAWYKFLIYVEIGRGERIVTQDIITVTEKNFSDGSGKGYQAGVA